jgi:glycosyltransferase involved in cell wall biosynthesis
VKIKNRKDIRFIVVGTGPNWGSVVELSKKMGLERFVWFTGYIPDRELYEILTTVDICVNPEFGNEFTDRSTMIKIMEYMTFGKPIVQFQTAEGEVTAAEAALYVKENSEYEFAETLLGLLEDQQKREIMGAKGRERIEKQLSWGRQKENLRKAYEYISSKVVAS